MWSNIFRTFFIISILFNRSTKNAVDSAKYPSSHRRHDFPFQMIFPMCSMDYISKYGRASNSHSSNWNHDPSDFLSVERVSNEVFDHGYEGSEEFLKHGPNEGFLSDNIDIEISGRSCDGSKRNVDMTGHFSFDDTARRNMQKTTAKPTSKPSTGISEPKEELKNKIEPPYYKANDTFGSIFGNAWNSTGPNSTKKRVQARWLPNFCDHMRRVIGGWYVLSMEQLPYMAYVDSGCGGSIISEDWVITAAHCIVTIAPHYVYVGGIELLGGCQYKVSTSYVHPSHSLGEFRFDIGLLRIDPKIIYSPAVKPIKLGTNRARVGACGIVAGWGTETFGGTLAASIKMAIIPVVLQRRCMLSGLHYQEFCAGYIDGSRDTCQGDSGGPFVVDDHLVGITSHGRRCGQYRSPGVYVNVWFCRDWITQITGFY